MIEKVVKGAVSLFVHSIGTILILGALQRTKFGRSVTGVDLDLGQ